MLCDSGGGPIELSPRAGKRQQPLMGQQRGSQKSPWTSGAPPALARRQQNRPRARRKAARYAVAASASASDTSASGEEAVGNADAQRRCLGARVVSRLHREQELELPALQPPALLRKAVKPVLLGGFGGATYGRRRCALGGLSRALGLAKPFTPKPLPAALLACRSGERSSPNATPRRSGELPSPNVHWPPPPPREREAIPAKEEAAAIAATLLPVVQGWFACPFLLPLESFLPAVNRWEEAPHVGDLG